MNKPLLFAAMVAALPLGAAAQQGDADAMQGKAPPQPGCAGAEEAPRASSALPARASTRPEPQLGTVAPNTRVPSHTVTPSMRAMRAARAKEATHADRDAVAFDAQCTPAVSRPGEGRDTKKS